MRIKAEDISRSSLSGLGGDVENNKENLEKFKASIQLSQNQWASVKTEIYQTIDARASDASVYRIDGASDNDGVDYTSKPSEFLEKAYATQTFDEQGEGIMNRHQAYITAGKAFDEHCKEQTGALDPDIALCDDAGQTLAAVNAVLSMLNRFEAMLIMAQTDPYEYDNLADLVPTMSIFTDLLSDVAEKSTIIELIPEQTVVEQTVVEPTVVEQALSGLADLMRSMKRFFSDLFAQKQVGQIEEPATDPTAPEPTAPEPAAPELSSLSSSPLSDPVNVVDSADFESLNAHNTEVTQGAKNHVTPMPDGPESESEDEQTIDPNKGP